MCCGVAVGSKRQVKLKLCPYFGRFNACIFAKKRPSFARPFTKISPSEELGTLRVLLWSCLDSDFSMTYEVWLRIYSDIWTKKFCSSSWATELLTGHWIISLPLIGHIAVHKSYLEWPKGDTGKLLSSYGGHSCCLRVEDVHSQDLLAVNSDWILSSWLAEDVFTAPLNAGEWWQWVLQLDPCPKISSMVQIGINCAILVGIRSGMVIKKRITSEGWIIIKLTF